MRSDFQRPATMIAVSPIPLAVRSCVMPTRGEWPVNPSPSPAARVIAVIRLEIVRPVRMPKTRASGSGSSGRM